MNDRKLGAGYERNFSKMRQRSKPHIPTHFLAPLLGWLLGDRIENS